MNPIKSQPAERKITIKGASFRDRNNIRLQFLSDNEDESPKQSVFASKSRPSLEHEDESPKKSVFSAKIPAGHVELTLADFPPRGASKPRKKGTNSKLKDHTEQESGPFATNAHPQHEDPGK
ncbi:hypothetical protein K438DRAFT_1772606 [Mycena galopus ATCC 62051]|nr:hypothetical protein K438DRAFT_1772606 [Mycena galopus ATCC 62051]